MHVSFSNKKYVFNAHFKISCAFCIWVLFMQYAKMCMKWSGCKQQTPSVCTEWSRLMVNTAQCALVTGVLETHRWATRWPADETRPADPETRRTMTPWCSDRTSCAGPVNAAAADRESRERTESLDTHRSTNQAVILIYTVYLRALAPCDIYMQWCCVGVCMCSCCAETGTHCQTETTAARNNPASPSHRSGARSLALFIITWLEIFISGYTQTPELL